jgi:hypothetical protein
MAKNNLHEKLLEALEMQLHSMKDNIVEVQAELIAEGYTTHPIFIAHRGETDLGQPYLDREEYNLFYEEDKNDEFRKAYGKTNENTCILCVFSEEAQFVFFPLANQKTDT